MEKTLIKILISITLAALIIWAANTGAKLYLKFRSEPIEWKKVSP